MANEAGAINGVKNLVQFLNQKGVEVTESEINSVFADSLQNGSEVLENGVFIDELAKNYNLDAEDEEFTNLIETISSRDGVLETLSYDDLNSPYQEAEAVFNSVRGLSADKIQKDEDGNYYVIVDGFDINKKDNLDCVSRLIYNIYGVSLYTDEGLEIYKKLVEANPDILMEDYNETVIHPDQRINLVDISAPVTSLVEEGTDVGEAFGGADGGAGSYVSETTLSDEEIGQYAQKLHDSMNDGLGVNEADFNELINNDELTADDWVKILSSYDKMFDKSFIQDVDGDFNSGDRTKIMNQITSKILDSAEQGNTAAIELLCSELYNATADMHGTADEFVKSVLDNASDDILASVMDNYNKVTGSEIYKDFENDFSGKTEKDYLNKLEVAYKNAVGDEYSGWDDGDLSIQAGAKSFGEGVVENIKGQVGGLVSTVVEHPVMTAATAGVVGAACVIGGPVVVAGLGIAGVGTAIFGAVKAVGNTITNMNNYNSAQTDNEAKEAMQDIGSSTFEVAENVVMGAFAVGQTAGAVKAAKAASAAKAAVNTADDAAKAAVNTADDAAKAAQERINELNVKYKNRQLSESDFRRLIEEEYGKIRRTGKYAIDYGENNYSGSMEDLQRIVSNPENSKVGILNQKRWNYRIDKNIPVEQIGQRASLNVKGDANLIKELDNLMTNGQYIDDAGNIIKIDVSDFYYKTASNVADWVKREDPITIYFRGDANSSTLEAIKQIAGKYARGALNGASSEAPYMMLEKNPTTAMIKNVISAASKISETLARAMFSKVRIDPGNIYVLSSGEYKAFISILKEYSEYLKLLG